MAKSSSSSSSSGSKSSSSTKSSTSSTAWKNPASISNVTVTKGTKVISDPKGQLTSTQKAALQKGWYTFAWSSSWTDTGSETLAPEKPTTKWVAETPTIVKPTPAPSTIEVIKTNALQSRIDARNKAGLNAATNPYTQKPEDVWVVPSEWVKAENAPPVVETPPPVQPAPEPAKETPVKTVEQPAPVKTPEEQAAIDEKAKQAEIDNQKVIADKAAADAAASEANNKWEIKTPLTQDEAFVILQSGGKLEKTAQSAVYESRFRQYQKLNNLSASTIADLNAGWWVTPAILNYIQKTNPEKYAEIQKLTDDKIKIDNINSTWERLYNKSTGKITVPEKKKSEEILEDWMTKFNEADAYTKSLMNKLTDWEVSDMAVNIARLDAEKEEIEDAMEYQYDDMRGQFPDVPKAIMMGMVAAQNKELNRSLNTKIRERAVAVAEYNAKKEDIRTQIEFSQTSMKNTMDFLWNMFNITRAEEMRQEDWTRADKLLADEIERADKKDQQRIEELKQTRTDTMALALAWAWVDPTKYNTYEWMLTAYSKAVKTKMIEDNKYKASASDWKEVSDGQWGTYLLNMVTKEKWSPNSWTPSPLTNTNTPTWKLVSVNTGNKNVEVDEIAAPWLTNAIQEMKDSGIYVVTGKANRDQVQTIKEMAQRYWVMFNPWNPADTADELTRRWHIVARPWYSKHEWWMAIDLYSNPNLAAPSKAQIDIMAKNWWKHAWISWDMGHFEYVGTPQTEGEKTYTDRQISIMEWLDPSSISKEEKTTLKNNGITEAEWLKYRKDNNIYSDKQILNAWKADTWFSGLKEVKDYKEMYTANEWIMQSLLSNNPVWNVGMVYQFMKTLDPSSVVRESEFALAANASWFADRNEPANLIRKVIEWYTLTPKQEKQMATLSQNYVKAKATVYKKSYEDYLKKYKSYGLTPEDANIQDISSSTGWSMENMSDADIWASL